MKRDTCGLTEIPKIKRGFRYHEDWNFGKGDVRKAFQKVFSPESTYVLFQTIANKQAVEALRGYVGFRDGMNSPWKVRKIRKGEDIEYFPGASDSGNGLHFDNGLMDSYQKTIDDLANLIVKKSNFARYPLVSTRGVHSLERDPNAIFWPMVYIVKDEKQDELKGIIDNLLNGYSFQILKDVESPQFYHMAEIEMLHEKKIKPIIRLERELHCEAQELSQYIDFLSQMTETYEWTGPVTFID